MLKKAMLFTLIFFKKVFHYTINQLTSLYKSYEQSGFSNSAHKACFWNKILGRHGQNVNITQKIPQPTYLGVELLAVKWQFQAPGYPRRIWVPAESDSAHDFIR